MLKNICMSSIADVYFSSRSYFSVNEDTTSVTPCVSSRSEVELRAYIYSPDFGKCLPKHIHLLYAGYSVVYLSVHIMCDTVMKMDHKCTHYVELCNFCVVIL